jgi:neutral trehalase
VFFYYNALPYNLGYESLAELQANTNWTDISPSQQEIYRNIRSGAETGWDFSSR